VPRRLIAIKRQTELCRTIRAGCGAPATHLGATGADAVQFGKRSSL